MAKEPSAPLVDLHTDGTDVSLITDLFIGYLCRPLDLYEAFSNSYSMQECIQFGHVILSYAPEE